MTYLEMVNNILKRLREREVAFVDENSYSKLIGVLINDAIVDVENAWDWTALRTTLTVTTQADVFNYELNTTQSNFSILNVLNDTDDTVMLYKDSNWMDKMFLATNTEKGSPYFYSFNGVSVDGDTQVDVFPIPDGVYDLRFNVAIRSAELSADTDTPIVPVRPVLLLAYAKAVEERGEDGGVGSSMAYANAQRALSDAISYDANLHPEDLIWNEV